MFSLNDGTVEPEERLYSDTEVAALLLPYNRRSGEAPVKSPRRQQ